MQQSGAAAPSKKREPGFTLVELMVTVVILAILVSIAYPAYQQYTYKARRADGMDALLYTQVLQEKYRANNPTYGTLAQTGYQGSQSREGHYRIDVSGNTATSYIVTATAVGRQAADLGCSEIAINVSAANPRGVKVPSGCWSK